MSFLSRAIGIVAAASLLAGSALAQTTAPAPAAKAEKPRSAVSLDCSKQADAKGLHGKERHKFRSKCKRDAAKK